MTPMAEPIIMTGSTIYRYISTTPTAQGEKSYSTMKTLRPRDHF